MNETNQYDINFYKNLELGVLKSSKELVPIICSMFSPKSILDVGCGNGIWLNTFSEHGISDYQGLDGDYVEQGFFKANYEQFKAADLETEINLNRKFDIAISFEVGEHLEMSKSVNLVKTLCNHADVIVFSAAIPFQSGTNHINEQNQSFWAKLFKDQGYEAFDSIRPLIWHNSKIAYWYRQNIVVYKNNQKGGVLNLNELDKMHPELYFRLNGKNGLLKQLFSKPSYVFNRFLGKIL